MKMDTSDTTLQLYNQKIMIGAYFGEGSDRYWIGMEISDFEERTLQDAAKQILCRWTGRGAPKEFLGLSH
jgi:hypothetical protein